MKTDKTENFLENYCQFLGLRNFLNREASSSFPKEVWLNFIEFVSTKPRSKTELATRSKVFN